MPAPSTPTLSLQTQDGTEYIRAVEIDYTAAPPPTVYEDDVYTSSADATALTINDNPNRFNHEIRNLSVTGQKYGVDASYLAELNIRGYEFNDVNATDAAGAALWIGGAGKGFPSLTQSARDIYFDGKETPDSNFLDQNNYGLLYDYQGNPITLDEEENTFKYFMREATIRNFGRSCATIKNNAYIAFSTLENANRVIEVYPGAVLHLYRSNINTGANGTLLIWLADSTASVVYHDCLFNGSPTPPVNLMGVGSLSASQAQPILQTQIINAAKNPLFENGSAVHPLMNTTARQVQIQYRYDPGGGFGSWTDYLIASYGDWLWAKPDIGAGDYEVRGRLIGAYNVAE